MSELLLRQKLSRHKELRISELSSAALADQGCDSWLASKTGLFLYILDERPIVGGITVLAHLPSHDAAFLLFDSVLSQLAPKARQSRKNRTACATVRSFA